MRFQSRNRPNGLAANMLQSGMHALKRLQAYTAAKLEALLPAILDRALKGEL